MSAICIPRLRTKRSRKGAAGLVIGYLDIWVSGKAPHQIIKTSLPPHHGHDHRAHLYPFCGWDKFHFCLNCRIKFTDLHTEAGALGSLSLFVIKLYWGMHFQENKTRPVWVTSRGTWVTTCYPFALFFLAPAPSLLQLFVCLGNCLK